MSGLAVTLVALSLISGPPKHNPNPWKKVDSSDGITVWQRDVPDSNIREVKAEAEIEVASKRVFDVIMDVDHYKDFMPYVEEARIIAKAGPRARYVYQLLDPPLVDARDYTLLVRGDGDPDAGLYMLSWEAAVSKGPAPIEDVVRIGICDGSWTIEAVEKNKTHATYHLYTDPGGQIPAWIANMANTRSLPDLMNSIRKRSKNKAWTR